MTPIEATQAAERLEKIITDGGSFTAADWAPYPDGKRFHVRSLNGGWQVYGLGLLHVCECSDGRMANMVANALEAAACKPSVQKQLSDLEEANRRLRGEIRLMQQTAERHNREAFATGLIVHCTGCEAGGPFSTDELTEERVQQVERIATRLRMWWDNHQARQLSSNP